MEDQNRKSQKDLWHEYSSKKNNETIIRGKKTRSRFVISWITEISQSHKLVIRERAGLARFWYEDMAPF